MAEILLKSRILRRPARSISLHGLVVGPKAARLDFLFSKPPRSAFGKIVNSLVAEVTMPPMGAAMKGVDFSILCFSLDGENYETLALAKSLGAPVIGYGMFLNTVIEFLIVAAYVLLS